MIDTKIKTKVEIIEETAAFYNSTNRGYIKDKGCVYYDIHTGVRCAVGRCLNDSVKLSQDDHDNRANDLFKMKGFGILKEEYRIKDISFWNSLQSLHDNEIYWNSTGLSQDGIEYKNNLIKTYND